MNTWEFNQELCQEGRGVVQVGRGCLQIFSHCGAAPGFRLLSEAGRGAGAVEGDEGNVMET